MSRREADRRPPSPEPVPPVGESGRPWLGSWLCAAALVGLVLATYWPTLGFQFLGWDDNLNITDNARLNPPSLSNVAQFWREPQLGLYAPLSYTFFSLEAVIARLPAGQDATACNPRVFHAGNVLLHALCVVLVFSILGRLTAHRLAATCGAALFAIHPLQTETVAWVTESRGLLAALFTLAAVRLWLATPRAERTGRYAACAAAIALLFGLGLLSKPSAVAAPAIIAALALTRGESRRADWALVAALALAASALLLFTKLQQPDEAMREIFPIWSRPFVALDSLAFYLYKSICPAALSADYGWRPLAILDRAWFFGLALVPLAVAIVVWKLRSRTLACLALLFVAALLPVLGVVPFGFQQISTVADRYAYLAMLAVALAVAELLRRQWSFGWCVGSVAVLAVLLLMTREQSEVWRNDDRLFANMLSSNPHSFVAYTNLGVLRHRHVDPDGALLCYQKAIDANPNYPLAWFNQGVVHMKTGRHEQARDSFETADRLAPDRPETLNNLARVLIGLGQVDEAVICLRRAANLDPQAPQIAANLGDALARRKKFDEAEREFRRAIALAPDSSDAHFLFAEMWRRQGRHREAIAEYNAAALRREQYFEAYYSAGEMATFIEDWPTAQRFFAMAVRCNPRLVQAQYQLAYSQIKQGQLDSGVARAKELLARYPGYVDPYHALAQAELMQGNPSAAIEHYRTALSTKPDWFMAKQQLAWIYATCDDEAVLNPGVALLLSAEAAELARGKSATAIDTLAAAHAAAGEFAQAASEARRALELAREQRLERLALAIEGRLDLYEAGAPYRDRTRPETVAARRPATAIK